MASSSTRKKPRIRILGVMTGTSCDALDAACVGFTQDGWEMQSFHSEAYPQALRERVLEIQKPSQTMTLKSYLELNRDLGLWYARALDRVLKKCGPVDAIANHGQTLAHHPATRDQGVTLQSGDATRIGSLTGLTVISDFRSGDISAGGQGAPLVPLYHAAIAPSLGKVERGISIHNIGGISNFTYLGPRGKMLALDTGPGNAWLDQAASLATAGKWKMDKDGKLSRQGIPDLAAVDRILAHPYFAKKPPKSTGRDDFPFELLLRNTRARGADLVATAALITIESIAAAYRMLGVGSRSTPLDRVFVCGGGAQNPVLLEGMSVVLPGTRVQALEGQGLDAQTLEAQAFAYFGFLALLGRPVGGSWTGSQGFAPPAAIYPGTNWQKLMDTLSRFR